MRVKFFIFIIFFCLSIPFYPLEKIGTWAKVFGDKGNDVFTSSINVDGGGFILAGYTTSRGDEENCWILNIDSSGAILWEKVYDFGDNDRIISVSKLADNSFYFCGRASIYGKDEGIIGKIKPNGVVSFANRFSFGSSTIVKKIKNDGTIPYFLSISNNDSFFSKGDSLLTNVVIKDCLLYDFTFYEDGGFVIVGEKNETPFFLLIDKNMNFKKAFLIYPSNNNKGRITSITRLKDTSYIIGGELNVSSNFYSLFIVKLDSSLTPLWFSSFEMRQDASLKSLISLQNGDFLISGTFRPSENDPFDGYFSIWDISGNLTLQRRYGGTLSDEIWDIAPSIDGGFLLCGKTKSYGRGGEEGFVLKIDSIGDVDPSCDFIKNANLSISLSQIKIVEERVAIMSASPLLNPASYKEKEPLQSGELLCYNGPAILSVTKKSEPFRLVLNGVNFRKGCYVYIGDSPTPWNKTLFIDGTKVILKGDDILKSKFPKGVPVLIRLFNPDGRGTEITFTR